MPKSQNQKLKLLYLLKILYEETDDSHGLTMSEIIRALEAYGISAERKSIYADIEALRLFGADVISEGKGTLYTYHIGKREFELPELKLLTDAVQAARFITRKKSRALISKLEGLAGKHEATKLHRQIFVTGRTKAENESVYYNVDLIYEAMGRNRKIKFQYFNWNEKKELVLRRNGDFYILSPWSLIWDDENYYLVAYDSEAKMLKHYRVDKMLRTEILESEEREGRSTFEDSDIKKYSDRLFGMFGGELERVRLECRNSLAGVMIDRFGKDAAMVPLADKDSFVISFDAFISPQLMGWIFGLGSEVSILGPESLKEMFRERFISLQKRTAE